MSSKHIIIYAFHSLEDPLVNGLILEYLKGTKAKEEGLWFHLITHEQKEFTLTAAEILLKKNALLQHNIKWYPVKYRSGALLLLKKALNFLQTFFIALKIKIKYKPTAILGFLSIAGGYSYIISKLLNLKLIIYCFEPHSDYMIDFKIWKKTSLKYKLLHYFEYLQLKHADFLVVPNSFTKSLAQKINSTEFIFVCPISIDTDRMSSDEEAGKKIRKEINADDKPILIYTGKFGGIYYSSDEIIKFFSTLLKHNNNLFLYVITPNIEEVKQSIEKFKLPQQTYSVSLTVAYNELNRHISAADIGLIAVPPLPSQRFRTPVKTAIYLSCGIPYMINKNVGNDDIIAMEENIGLVIEDFSEDASGLSERITKLLSEGRTVLKARCRNYALAHRSTKTATAILNKIFSNL